MSAQAYASADALRTALRKRIGMYDPNAVTQGGVSDTELDECIQSALNEINNRQPLWYFTSFNTVALQQAYTVSWPAGKNGPPKIFYRGPNVTCTVEDLSVFQTLGDLGWIASAIVVGNSAIPYIDETALELGARFFSVVQRYMGGRGEEMRDGKIWLTPRPSNVMAVYAFCPIERYANAYEATKQYIEPLLAFAAHRAFLALASKQSEVKKVDDGASVLVETMGGAMFMQLAKEERRNFDRQWMVPVTMSKG